MPTTSSASAAPARCDRARMRASAASAAPNRIAAARVSVPKYAAVGVVPGRRAATISTLDTAASTSDDDEHGLGGRRASTHASRPTKTSGQIR